MPEGYLNRLSVSIKKVKVVMGISEFLLIALVGLALFGGAVNIEFKGITRRIERRELKGRERKQLNK